MINCPAIDVPAKPSGSIDDPYIARQGVEEEMLVYWEFFSALQQECSKRKTTASRLSLTA